MRLIRAALRELTDLELAYFAIYTTPKLADETRQKIWTYLDERGLNKINAKALIELHECNTPVSEDEQCPNCKSSILTTPEPQQSTKSPTWLTYTDILADRSKHRASHWPVATKKCFICNAPVKQKAGPQPSVPGIRVFTNSLRS